VPVHDPELAAVDVAAALQGSDRGLHAVPLDDDVDVNDRLRLEAFDGRAADMLDADDRDSEKRVEQVGADPVERSWPCRVVRNDLDR
jgi:hypothetical protein